MPSPCRRSTSPRSPPTPSSSRRPQLPPRVVGRRLHRHRHRRQQDRSGRRRLVPGRAGLRFPAARRPREEPGRPDNLYQPVDQDKDYGAHGVFDDRAHAFSPQLVADQHLRLDHALAGAAGAVCDAVANGPGMFWRGGLLGLAAGALGVIGVRGTEPQGGRPDPRRKRRKPDGRPLTERSRTAGQRAALGTGEQDRRRDGAQRRKPGMVHPQPGHRGRGLLPRCGHGLHPRPGLARQRREGLLF